LQLKWAVTNKMHSAYKFTTNKYINRMYQTTLQHASGNKLDYHYIILI